MKKPYMKRSLGTILLMLTLTCAMLQAQGLGGGSSRIEGKAKFMPVPYINYDRSFGFTAGAVPMLMFNPSEKDTISPSSIVGAVGTYSSNKTWFLMGFGIFFLGEDNWRITTAGGVGGVNYQFYLEIPGGGLWVPYGSDATFYMLRVERRIWEKLYGGISYVYAHVLTNAENLPLSDTLNLNGLGLNLSLDRRDNPHYPRRGHISEIKYNFFPVFMGNDVCTRKLELSHNHYFSVRQHKDVVAVRGFAGLGITDLAFNQQFIVKNTDIRGYSQGAFRGDYLLSAQGEYRWNFHRRWGAVGFAGVATIFDAINESDNGKLLPGAGAGIRFRVFTETNFSVGLDVAAGVDDWGIYFQIGEAF